MSPFAPLDGDRARWRVLLELFADAEIGDVLDYPTLADALDLDPVRDRHAVQMAARRASAELSVEHLRSTEAVRGVGYRVVEPSEQLRLAADLQRRSTRQLERSHAQVVNVDHSELPEALVRAFRAAGQLLATQLQFNSRMELKTANLERALEAATRRSAATEEDVAALAERLAQFEERLDRVDPGDDDGQ